MPGWPWSSVVWIPAFVRATKPVMAGLVTGDLLGMLAEGEHLVEAVAIATGEDRAWLDGLEADDFVKLAECVIEVNAGFFVHRLAPAIAQASATLNATLGATSSPAYSAAASDSTTA